MKEIVKNYLRRIDPELLWLVIGLVTIVLGGTSIICAANVLEAFVRPTLHLQACGFICEDYCESYERGALE